jgi:hypothetical protein
MNAAAGTRRVEVEALSARTELLLVLRAAMVVTVALWVYLALAASDGGVARQRNLLPFQKLIADRPPDEQRMFRELQEGLLEAEAARATAGRWPATAALAADGIPPFGTDPTARLVYEWRLVKSGTIVNYLGLPKAVLFPGEGAPRVTEAAPAWLVFVQEPAPGVPPDQTFEDEEHHRLAGGAMLHVSTWVHSNGPAVPERLIRMPQSEGWTQLYAVGPSAVRLAGSK